MTQMESPKRKMQKKNDYQRHKLFRKIKRRRKAQAEAEQHIAEKQLRRKLKLPKFDTGDDAKIVYLRDIVGHDPYTGEDILKTGERVSYDDVQDFNTYENFKVNAGGHIRVLGEYGEPSKNAFYSQDIWKFNPKDYTQKWGVGSKIKSWGLKKIDKLGTPVITRSEWEEAPTFDNWYQAGHYQSGKDINIKKSKRGTFTKAAKQHGMSVQGFANKVLRNPSKYSAAMRKKANFARNASKWNK